MPILSCNYDCPYCITETRNNRVFDVPKDEHRIIPASSWCTWWSFIKHRSERCDVYVSGGEPSTYPGFDEFIQAVDRMPGSHWLATNLSRPIPSLEEGLIKRFDVDASAHLTEPKFDPVAFLKRARTIANHAPLRIKVIHGHAPAKELAEFQAAAAALKLRLTVTPDRQDKRKATPPLPTEADPESPATSD
jgi:organic radical activating enzyme